ncbi:hypothetical protein HHL16_15550 [Pseudoflavitalea sp. G-6-1-2]|uniref:S41 family peptidase n=1 Tax=Pseudoflavitalea sp. G-6-1-2 TaxID=2728841 RepID=UPI00146DA383|nr:S41 family peptidase [Pseudoflavitalea sp. G-6-1-2]NML22298.1 hypothetical protein [Pseudoflavitalea sp. G-6-1-2]
MMRQIKTAFLFLFLLCIFETSNGQVQTGNANISRKENLQSDFTCLRDALQAEYPSLYRFTPKEKMDQLLDSCYNSLRNSTTDLEFYRLTKFVLSAARDGHLGCTPPDSLLKHIREDVKFFPVRLHFVRDKAYVIGTADSSLPAGAEIISINNQPVSRIQNELFRFIVSDGFSNTKKLHVLDNYFYFYYFLVKGSSPSFDIKYSTEAGSTASIKLSAVAERDIPPAIDILNREKLLDLKITEDKIAILTIRTFDEDEMAQAGLVFSTFLYGAFNRIKEEKIHKLIIDLRGNGGGKDQYGSMLYGFLTKKTFNYYRSLTGSNPEKYRKTGNGYYEFDKDWHSNLKLQKPASVNYNDALWILIDGESFSATAEFCTIARSLNRGVFVGEETGGAYIGNTSGEQRELTLPTTGMKVQFGLWQYHMSVTSNHIFSRGIMPHQEVLLSANDLLQKHESQMEHAIRLAQKLKYKP